ncbi:hypothetical protein NEOC65_002089 [Neochlamydia sp. AcF65]|nr:hypothetical protein [Neochlamydia sp. AcF65]
MLNKGAEDWAQAVERQIKAGKYKSDRVNYQGTFLELVDRYKAGGILDHLKSAKDVLRHLEYWKVRLGVYALVHLNSNFLLKERALLIIDNPTQPLLFASKTAFGKIVIKKLGK